jgi:DNA (cytosine-5)-methyltransferase 1
LHANPARTEREALGKPASKFRPNPNAIPQPIPGVLSTLDLFSGCGGFATALHRAARKSGFRVMSTLLNHWNAAIEDVDPLEVIPTGYVDLLLASPECIFFSSARGAKPINEQRRSSAAELLRFLEALYVETFIMENVEEMQDWCGLDENLRPIKERKGEYFQAFIKALKTLGYDVRYDTLVAANYGDPTTRKRLFLVAQKSRRASLPVPTHSKGGAIPDTLPWVPAREIIDFSVKGHSIFARSSPHALNPHSPDEFVTTLRIRTVFVIIIKLFVLMK